LPTAVTKLEAKLSRGIDEIPSIDDIEAEVTRLEKITLKGSESKEQILALAGEIKKAKLAGQVLEMKEDLESKGNQNDKTN
jgi:ribosomal protein L6P/L9E